MKVASVGGSNIKLCLGSSVLCTNLELIFDGQCVAFGRFDNKLNRIFGQLRNGFLPDVIHGLQSET